MSEEPTTAAVPRDLNALAGDAPALRADGPGATELDVAAASVDPMYQPAL